MASLDTVHVIYAGAAITGILASEAAYLLFAGKQERREAVNRRLKLQEGKLSQKDVLLQLRKESGATGGAFWSFGWLRRMKSQSGMAMSLQNFLAICAVIAGVIAFMFNRKGIPVTSAAGIFALLAMVIPVVVLKHLKKRRHKLFGTQLPEALELITRSLKAGHPVPVAIALVAREMADPIGTEFGIIADEVTYGSDLVSALNNMYDRVGHEDLPLFITAVAIQSSTGGNLREILDGLAGTIRDRGKLRRKVRAISTEGRVSAYVLTAVPILLFVGIWFTNPTYYQSVIDREKTWMLLGGAAFWLVLGNVVMAKMSNFKF